MISILLMILKVIGILLLVILGLILLIIATILFVPIRYRAKGLFYEEQKKADLSVTWGLVIFRIRAGYEYGKEFFYSFRILGITILTSEEKETIPERFLAWRRRRKAKKKTSFKDKQRKRPVSEKASKIDTGKSIEKSDKPKFKREESAAPPIIPKEKNRAAESPPLSESEKIVEELFQKCYNNGKHFLSKFLQKGASLLKKVRWIWSKEQSVADKIEELYDRYEKLERFYYHRKTQYAIQKMIALLKKTIIYILPVRYRGKLRYGFDDPSMTGKLYGVLCVTGVALRDDFFVEADYQEEVLEGDIRISGRLRVIFFVRLAITIYFDKQLKAVYREGKRLAGGK